MSDVLHDFTTTVPHWRPRVTPIKLEDATPDQLDALKVTPSNTKVSDYILVLARDSETLRERTPLFNAIMYNRGGMSRAERELGAVGTSVVNRCVYCAAVHASRYNVLAKDTGVMERIFTDEDKAELDPASRRSSISPSNFRKRRRKSRRRIWRRSKPQGWIQRRFSTWSYRPHSLDGRTGSCIRWAIRSRRKISGRSAEGLQSASPVADGSRRRLASAPR